MDDIPKFLPSLFFILHLSEALILGVVPRNNQEDFWQVESFDFFVKIFVL